MKHRDIRQRRKEVPIWLKKLDLVRSELRQMRFPRTAEEGLRQCAELSDVSMSLFKQEIGKRLRTGDEEMVARETWRLMARFSINDQRWGATRRRDLATPQ